MRKEYRRRKESEEQFSPWETYSDLYCGLLLVFVLLFFFAIYQYIDARERNNSDTQALQESMKEEQEAVLALYKAELGDQMSAYETKESELALQQSAMAILQADLEEQSALVLQQESELGIQSALLDERENELAKQSALNEKQSAALEEQQTLLAQQESELERQSALLDERESELEEQGALNRKQESELEKQNALNEKQTAALKEQQTLLAQQESELERQSALLDERESELEEQSALSRKQESELEKQQTLLQQRESELGDKDAQIRSQQELIDEQARSIEAIVGVRRKLIETINEEMKKNDLEVEADQTTGAIIFSSSILFELDSNVLSAEGKAFFREFLPVYMRVLMQDQFRPYISELLVEGHTDTSGTYLHNLELSQGRAYSVAKYFVEGDGGSHFLPDKQIDQLRSWISANGCADRTLIYKADGSIDADRSRRVEVKFRLKDEEMIEAMNEILNN